MKAAALQYAARGWHVLPIYPVTDGSCGCGNPSCNTPGKHPIGSLVHRGLHNASAFAAHVDAWWTQWPDANVAIRTGSASQLVVIDLDDRPLEGRDGQATWRRLLASYSHGQSPETVEALTGGGGRHVYFQCPPGVLITSSKDTLGPGVEVKAEGGYVVAPPSTHTSGRTYEWELSSHPDDVSVAEMPDWLLALVKTRTPRTAAEPRLHYEMHPLEVAELQSALLTLPSDDRADWIAVGMALHATGDDDAGFTLWDEWSATSSKYQGIDDLRKTWASFSQKPDGLTVATVYAHAIKAGWQRPTLAQLADAIGLELPDLTELLAALRDPAPVAVPAAITQSANPLQASLPGQLETLAQWSLATAPHPVRGYAVAAALGLGSVLSARRYVTDAGNYASLYLLVVGKSGTGKEHVRKTIDDVLQAIDQGQMVGPNKWTSDSAVFSGLLQAPQQIAVLDEFGQFLGSASSGGDSASMKDGMLTLTMELYGRLGGRAQSPQFATLSLSQAQQEAAKRKMIDRPALTIVGLTTPSTWYSALKSSRIASGFLNRFCVLETETARGDYAIPSLDAVPDSVQEWARQLLAPTCDLDLLPRCTNIPDAVRVQIEPAAHVLFTQFRRDCNRRADSLEKEQLGELPMRAAEQAMRLALIATLADDPTARRLRASHASWGVDVASYLLSQLVPAVQSRMADSPLALLRKRFVQLVQESGEQGLTEYEMRRTPLLHGVTRRDRDDLVAWVLEAQHCAWGVRTHSALGGRPARVLRVIAVHNPENGV